MPYFFLRESEATHSRSDSHWNDSDLFSMVRAHEIVSADEPFDLQSAKSFPKMMRRCCTATPDRMNGHEYLVLQSLPRLRPRVPVRTDFLFSSRRVLLVFFLL